MCHPCASASPHTCRRTGKSRGQVTRPSSRTTDLPAASLTLVLVLEPFLERREVLEDRARIHVALTGQLEQRVLPRLARAQRKHLLVQRARFLVVVDRALVQRPGEAGLLAQRA